MDGLAAHSDTPLISVVMPVYNTGAFVADAIRSILAQTWRDFEFIIIDDGSTDDSVAIMRQFAAQDQRIHPIFLDHVGAPKAMNIGVAAARGKLIARMDSDDIALPERLAAQLEWMNRTGVDVCGACAQRFGGGSGVWWVPQTHQAIAYELLFGFSILHPTILLHSQILRDHPYVETASADDYELWTRLAPLYKLGNVPRVLIKHRLHNRQMHIVEAEGCRRDVAVSRRRFIRALFPDASAGDYDLIEDMCAKESARSLEDLERAGRWLLLMSKDQNSLVQKRMASRWLELCRRSAHLGPKGFTVYQKLAPAFAVTVHKGLLSLRIASLLRLRRDSPLQAALSWTKRRFATASVDNW